MSFFAIPEGFPDMLAALTLFVVLTLSVLVIRTAAVALRITGLPEETARFQARSAFTGCGFTTTESESILRHPVRRRVVSILMVVGNLGFVSVMATVVVSLVGSGEAEGGILAQLLWLAAVLLVLWFVALNPLADRIMCGAIGKLLARSQGFGGRRPARLLQLPQGRGVTQLLAHRDSGLPGKPLGTLSAEGTVVLGVLRDDGSFLNLPDAGEEIRLADEIFIYGETAAVAALDGDGAVLPETAA